MTINGDGENRRDYTYVGDVVKANLLASESQNVGNGEVINIGSGINLSVNDVAKLIGENKVYRDPVKEPKETLADISKAKSLLNWSPEVRLEEWIIGYKKENRIKMSKKILITGGAGFIAHHVIDKIMSTTDWEIITLDRLDFSGNLNRLKEVVSAYPESEQKELELYTTI